ncbi:hypothetical protein [Paenibacillus terrae]|nr:hypothetical protein [Paenibacillus terrae]
MPSAWRYGIIALPIAGVHMIERILSESRKQQASYMFDQDSWVTD